MGWLFSESWPTASAMRDHLRDELTKSGGEIKKDALTSYGRHYFAAVKGKDEKTFVFVAALEKHGGDFSGWGYKDMDEFMGPYMYDCPLAVLDAADPLDDTNDPGKTGREWRAEVRAYHAKRAASRSLAKGLKSGDRLFLRGSKDPERAYTFARYNGRKILATRDWTLYRIPPTKITSVERAATT